MNTYISVLCVWKKRSTAEKKLALKFTELKFSRLQTERNITDGK